MAGDHAACAGHQVFVSLCHRIPGPAAPVSNGGTARGRPRVSSRGCFGKMGCRDPGLHRCEETQDQLLPPPSVMVRKEREGAIEGWGWGRVYALLPGHWLSQGHDWSTRVLSNKPVSPFSRMHPNLTKGFGMIGPKDFFPLLDFAYMPNNSLTPR